MEQFKNIYKIFLMMFSETIWIYYTIVMFTSIEWNELAYFNLTWFGLAGVMAYGLNLLIVKRVNYLFLVLMNILILGLLVFENWRNVVPDGAWGFGIGVTLGLSIIFLRSIRLVYCKPKRVEILHCFEGNVMCYIFFVVVFSFYKWADVIFHLIFVGAVIASLIGMVLTLQNHEDGGEDQKTKIIKVGQSGWFAGVSIILLILVPLFAFLLFLPSVNRGLYSLVTLGWESLKWLGRKVDSFLVWLVSLFPTPQMEAPPGAPQMNPDMILNTGEQTIHSLPIIWIVAVGSFLLIIFFIFLFSRLVRKMKLSKSIKIKQMTITQESWWLHFKRNLVSYLRYLSLKWRMAFPRYYYYLIYWFYHQVLGWGNKNGFPKDKSETSKEYIKKLIGYIPEKERSFCFLDRHYQVPELLTRLNNDYQATYYGEKPEISGEREYRLLIKHLKSIRIGNNQSQQKIRGWF